MRIEMLKEIENAPQSGQMLAYFRKTGVLFERYETLENVLNKLKEAEAADTLLELHLFDTSKEYRTILSKSKLRENGCIEYVSDFVDEDTAVYKEVVELEHGKGMMTVLNHIRYEENGMAVIDDYRLVMGEV